MPKKYILIILALSLLTRFAFFGHPAETVFDEVHFGKFVSGYFTGQYFFDIHPPLGKLMIAGMAKISGFQPGFSFENIGQKFPDDSYKWLRFLPKLAGALLPAIIFLIALELGISQKLAFLGGLFLVFENSLLVQSRFILLDSFLLLFGFSAILFFLKSKTSNKKYLFLSGLFSSLAFSVKWTGLGFLAIIGLFYFINWLNSADKLKLAIKGLIFLIIIPLAVYFSIFFVHFSLLDKPGPGLAFHPPNFQEMNIFKKFAGLNLELYRSNTRLGASHPYTSQWFQWPFMNKPVYYWTSPCRDCLLPTFGRSRDPALQAPRQLRNQDTPCRDCLPVEAERKIYFLGNPLIWWLSTIAVIYFVINFRKFKNSPRFLLLTSYFLNWLPFIFIGRVMFLYHYMTALVFAILILVYSLDKSKFGNKKIVFNTILTGSIILFLFFSPLTYGLAIPEWYYKSMVWLPAWR